LLLGASKQKEKEKNKKKLKHDLICQFFNIRNKMMNSISPIIEEINTLEDERAKIDFRYVIVDVGD